MNELVSSLSDVNADFSKYKNVRDARKILQSIKVEAQSLRSKLTENIKLNKKTIKTEKTVEAKSIEPISTEIPTVGIE